VPTAVDETQALTSPAGTALGLGVSESAERRAREDLRRQIAQIERRLGELFASSFPRQGLEWGIGAVGGPRLLDTGELERIRDSLALRLRDAQAELARRADAEEANRGLIERMITEPERHRWVRVSNQDIGERDCRHWHSRPRWGLLGMLFGWWRIRLPSGCPLAAGLRPPASPATALPDGKETPQAAPAPSIDDQRPPAPWGSFPLVELMVLVGLAMFVVGFFLLDGSGGSTVFVVGLAIASLAGLELSIREHFGGYRSHSLLLAGALGLATMLAASYLAGFSPTVGIVAGAAVAVLGFWALTAAFRRRSGRLVKLR
jgi:hypothetical protein